MPDNETSGFSQRDHARERFDNAVNKLHKLFQGFDDRQPLEGVWLGKDIVDITFDNGRVVSFKCFHVVRP